MSYRIKRVERLPELSTDWESDAWSEANVIVIENFLTPGHDHKPRTEARMLHDGETIAVLFHVEDRYVIAKGIGYQARTHKDSCVEFFVGPMAGKGYFNFELNCCETLLLSYIEDARRKEDGFERYTMVPQNVISGMEVRASLEGPILEEIEDPTVWTVLFKVPKGVFEVYLGAIGSLNGMRMRGNVYKCADESSHPHWGYWSDIGEVLDFHQPDKFGEFVFEG
jgi:hypothetical protein